MKAPWNRIADLTGRRGAEKERAAPKAPPMPDAPPALMERIEAMLRGCGTGAGVFPPAVLFNERWLLRLILDWFSRHQVTEHPLSFPENGRWFSDILLPSPFVGAGRRPKTGDPPCELGGLIGHFDVPDLESPLVSASPQTLHLMAVDGTMSGEMAPGVTGARYLDQTARTVAGMAEALRRANRRPSGLDRIGFYVIAPYALVAAGGLQKEMSRESIGRKVKRRVKSFTPSKERWHGEGFQPTLERLEVGIVAWEQVIERLGQQDGPAAAPIEEFYHRCLELSKRQAGESR